MGVYDLPGQISGRDRFEVHGSMGTGFIVLGNSTETGSIRVDRIAEGTDSTNSTRSSDWGERDREPRCNGG
jgi:hypothetical protein